MISMQNLLWPSDVLKERRKEGKKAGRERGRKVGRGQVGRK